MENRKDELSILIEKGGLQIETANILKERFAPFILQADEWSEKAKLLVVSDATQLAEMAKAREARLALKSVRLSISEAHKELKADSLKYTQTLDLIKRTLIGLIEPTEAHLQQQEDFIKIEEAKRKGELKLTREQMLAPFGIVTEFYNLGDMDVDAWESLYSISKKSYEDRIAFEKKSEEERIKREEAEVRERERIQLENEELKRKQAEQEKLLAEERLKSERILKEKQKADAEAKRIRDENERLERERIEAELKSKREAEERLRREAEEKAEAELSKGDKEKFQDLVGSIEQLIGKYQFESKKYKALSESVSELLRKTVNWANKQTTKQLLEAVNK